MARSRLGFERRTRASRRSARRGARGARPRRSARRRCRRRGGSSLRGPVAPVERIDRARPSSGSTAIALMVKSRRARSAVDVVDEVDRVGPAAVGVGASRRAASSPRSGARRIDDRDRAVLDAGRDHAPEQARHLFRARVGRDVPVVRALEPLAREARRAARRARSRPRPRREIRPHGAARRARARPSGWLFVGSSSGPRGERSHGSQKTPNG